MKFGPISIGEPAQDEGTLCNATWSVCSVRSGNFKVAGVTEPHKCEDFVKPENKEHGTIKDNPHHCIGCRALKPR